MTFNTPATPHKGIVSNQEIDTKISYDLQIRYRSGVGQVLNLVKHSEPELSNVVHKLYKFLDKASMGNYKYLMQ